MRLRRSAVVFTVVLLLGGTPSPDTVVGPPKGSLVIVGGNIQDLSTLRRFIDLADGSDAPIVMIPTAGGAPDSDQFWPGLKILREAGARTCWGWRSTGSPRLSCSRISSRSSARAT